MAVIRKNDGLPKLLEYRAWIDTTLEGKHRGNLLGGVTIDEEGTIVAFGKWNEHLIYCPLSAIEPHFRALFTPAEQSHLDQWIAHYKAGEWAGIESKAKSAAGRKVGI